MMAALDQDAKSAMPYDTRHGGYFLIQGTSAYWTKKSIELVLCTPRPVSFMAWFLLGASYWKNFNKLIK